MVASAAAAPGVRAPARRGAQRVLQDGPPSWLRARAHAPQCRRSVAACGDAPRGAELAVPRALRRKSHGDFTAAGARGPRGRARPWRRPVTAIRAAAVAAAAAAGGAGAGARGASSQPKRLLHSSVRPPCPALHCSALPLPPPPRIWTPHLTSTSTGPVPLPSPPPSSPRARARLPRVAMRQANSARRRMRGAQPTAGFAGKRGHLFDWLSPPPILSTSGQMVDITNGLLCWTGLRRVSWRTQAVREGRHVDAKAEGAAVALVAATAAS
eukprot:60539-Chlamydomonas_euryale.AAC.1